MIFFENPAGEVLLGKEEETPYAPSSPGRLQDINIFYYNWKYN